MSSNFWQIEKQRELFKSGRTLTQRVKIYLETWKLRCYDEIPETVPAGLAKTNRAPSWKSVAIAILRNDHRLISLGMPRKETELSAAIYAIGKEDKQLNIPGLGR